LTFASVITEQVHRDRKNKTNIVDDHRLSHQHNQLTTASAVMEEAERLQNTQNRLGRKRRKKMEATN
jgi:hypothetical protein